ncbi:glycosyltransferase [Actinokineospora sp.]|uniref:glycosyltransferase n=1 Tax=Actinokineospora sp. TaxID=1872133 RepID=UPI0040378A6E
MIPAWLLAVLTTGVGFLVRAVFGMLHRDRERGSLAVSRGEPVLGEVAVLIPARDAEGEIEAAIDAAARLVPRTDIHVVSDESADNTVDVAHARGVNVAETLTTLGRAGAVAAGVEGFKLADRYTYLLVLDVDHRPAPSFLDRTLPLFDDPEVVAVAGYAHTEWETARRTPVGRVLTAYRARTYAVVQWLLTVARTRPGAEASRWLPSPARMVRASALAELEVAPTGLAITDFDLSLQVYRRGLGRVVVVRGALVGTRDPDDLRTYLRQTRQWALGFWQALRRGVRPRVVLGYAADQVVTALVLVAVPVLLATGLVTWQAALVGVLLPDFVLTLLVALLRRDARYLLPGLAFSAVRVVDAAVLLAALPRGLFGKPVPAAWLSPVRGMAPEPALDTAPAVALAARTTPGAVSVAVPEAEQAPETVAEQEPEAAAEPVLDVAAEQAPEAGAEAVPEAMAETVPPTAAESVPAAASAKPPWWRTRSAAGLGWALAALSAAALTVRVALTSATLPVTAAEPTLVDAAFGRVAGLDGVPVPTGLATTNLQLVVYGAVTRAFDRYGSVLTSARELSVAAVGGTALFLILFAVTLRLRPLAVAVALAAATVCGPVVAALVPVGPGVIAAAWLAVAAAATGLAVARRDARPITVVVLALPGALVTAPALVVPLAVGAAVWCAGARSRLPGWRWPAAIGGALAVGAGAWVALSALGVLTVPLATVPGAQRSALLAGCVVAAAGGLLIARTRALAAGVVAAAVVAALLGPGGDALVPAGLAGALFVVTLLLHELGERVPVGGIAVAGRAGVALAALAVLAGAAWGAPRQPPSAPVVDHRAVVTWFTAAADPAAALSAPPLLWSELRRDLVDAGQSAARARPSGPADLTVSTVDDPAPPLARFGGLTVRLTGTGAGYIVDGNRTAAGAQLARNTRIDAAEDVRAALREGRVDLRAMTVLAEICATYDITVASTLNPAAERGSGLPHRTVVLSEVDGKPVADPVIAAALREWLAAQRPPYAPDDVRRTPRGVELTWRLPTLTDAAPRLPPR